MELKEYKTKDKVQVLINNPENRNINEWRDGIVVDSTMCYPGNGEKFKPYTMLVVSYIRTYYNNRTKVFYNKECIDGFVYNEQVRLEHRRGK